MATPAAITPIRRCVSAPLCVQYLPEQSACASANGTSAGRTPLLHEPNDGCGSFGESSLKTRENGSKEKK
jgi:hypothetical protein